MNENKQIFSKIGFNYLLLALIPILFQIIFVNAISLIDFNLIKNTNIQILVSSLTNYILVLPIFIYLMRKIKSVTIDKNGIKITQLLKYICVKFHLQEAYLLMSLCPRHLHTWISTLCPRKNFIQNSGQVLKISKKVIFFP